MTKENNPQPKRRIVPTPQPAWKQEQKKPQIRYKIDVDEGGYALIMRLVMKYASGTGVDEEIDVSSSIATRIDLANAKRYNAARQAFTDEKYIKDRWPDESTITDPL